MSGGDAELLALGARLSLRTTARYALSQIDAERWAVDEIAALRCLASMKIDGIPFGDWSQSFPVTGKTKEDDEKPGLT